MQRPTTTRIGVVVIALLLGSILAGCASQATTDRPVANNEDCKGNMTLVCEERMGKVIRCSCKSNHSINDIYRPSPY